MGINPLVNAWNKVYYGWDVNTMHKELEFVIDTSHWTTVPSQFNEEKFAQFVENKKVVGLIFKLCDANRSTGSQYYDKLAEFWYKLAVKYKLLTSGYGWLQPSVEPTSAWKFYSDWKKDHPFTLPNVIDFEEPSVTNYSDYAWRLQTWLGHSGDETMVYTADWYMDRVRTQMSNTKLSWMAGYPLWTAWYSRFYPTKKTEWITPWTDFVGWQFSDKADYPFYTDGDNLNGTEWGVSSLGGDTNWFKKSFLDKYRNSGVVLEPPVVEIEEPVVTIPSSGLNFIATTDMKIRSGAGTNYAVLGEYGELKKGEIVTPLNIAGNDCWVEIEPNKWVCKSKNGTEFLTLKEN